MLGQTLWKLKGVDNIMRLFLFLRTRNLIHLLIHLCIGIKNKNSRYTVITDTLIIWTAAKSHAKIN